MHTANVYAKITVRLIIDVFSRKSCMKQTLLYLIIIFLGLGTVPLGFVIIKRAHKVLTIISGAFLLGIGLVISGFSGYSLYQTSQISVVPNTGINLQVSQTSRNKLTNDKLSTMSADKLYQLYSANGQKTLDDLYGNHQKAKDFAVKTIGRELPAQLSINTLDKHSVNFQKPTIVVVLMANGKKSEDFVKTLNAVTNSKQQLLVIFPVDQNKDVKRFIKKTALNKAWQVATLEDNQKTHLQANLTDIATKYFNVAGVPAYLAISHNKVTLASIGTLKDNQSFANFISYAVKTPYLYDMMANQN